MYYLNMYLNVQLFTHIARDAYPKLCFWVHIGYCMGIFLSFEVHII